MTLLRIAALAAAGLVLPGLSLAQDLLPPAPDAPGTAAYNAWLGRSFSEVMLNEADAVRRDAMLDVLVAEDYVQHNPLLEEGRQGLKDFIPVIYQLMPDAEFILRDSFATEDRVVSRWTWTGTLTGGPLFGIEPEGQRLEFDAMDIWTVRDGQLYEHWDQFDWPRAFAQLGVEGLPEPFPTLASQPADR